MHASLSPVIISGVIDARGGVGYFSTAYGGLGQVSILGAPPIVTGAIHAGVVVLPNGVSNSQFYLDGGSGGGGGGAAAAEKRYAPSCVADLDDGSNTGTPDGGVTIDDLLYYFNAFEAGILTADLDDGSGTGTPDGGVTIDDLLYFLQRFEAGC